MAITLASRHKQAQRGERAVAAWLVQHGFHIVVTNFRRKALELDIIATKGRELLIIEVKTRSAAVHDWQQLIPPRKLSALWRGCQRFLDEHPEFSDFTVHLGLALVCEAEQESITWMRLAANLEP